ncbi:dnaB-like helicase C terminal domain protein, partial [Vibrio parahaemolyticus VPTS-2010]
LFCLA